MKNTIIHSGARFNFKGHIVHRLCAVFASLLLGACDSFTDVDLPSSQLTASAVFEDKITATAAMTNIYTQIRDGGLLSGNPQGLSNQLGVYADELGFYGSPGSMSFNFYNNTLLAEGNEIADLWNNTYSQIYAANAVIEGVSQSVGLSAADKNQLRGEALFVRALLHFYLGNSFGDVPYIKTTNYEQNRVVTRATGPQRNEWLEQDLNEAVALLAKDDVTAERVRPSRWAAQALLARLYLYEGKWAESSNAASAVLNEDGRFSIGSSPEGDFLKDSPGTIWQFMPAMEGANAQEADTFIFVSVPPPAVALSESLLAAFEPGDLRRAAWVKEVAGPGGTYYHANKYRERTNTGSSVEYSIVFRLAEMYLVRAEARAEQGDIIGAREDLNLIRHHAGLGDTPEFEQEGLVDAVLKERRIEFFTEFGHRFFDLKRSGKIDSILGGAKPGWDSNDRVFPLPQRELLINGNLAPQNPGY